MQIILFLMKVIIILLFIFILLSKFSIFHKIILIAGIYLASYLSGEFNDYLQVTIKHELKNKKLVEEKRKKSEKNIYGMPSGHAQYISFYMVLIYLFYANNNKDSRLFKGKYNYIYYLLIFIIMLYIIEFIICIVNNYHTPFEYIAGSILGGIVSYITYIILFLTIAKKN
jgi:membrane-associated phospholipid phosphatase